MFGFIPLLVHSSSGQRKLAKHSYKSLKCSFSAEALVIKYFGETGKKCCSSVVFYFFVLYIFLAIFGLKHLIFFHYVLIHLY